MTRLLSVALAAPILLALLVASVGACVDVSTDPNEVGGKLPDSDGPTVQFDPANSIIPFPNDLIPRDPVTHKLQLPAPCGEGPATTAIRTTTLNQLTGFGTYEAPIQLTFTDPLDATTLGANIVLYERAKGGTAVSPTGATPVPFTILSTASATQYPTGCSDPSTTVTAVTLVPNIALDENSTYVVAVLAGINTSNGVPFIPATTWALVRSTADPVTFDSTGAVTSNRTPLDPTVPAQLTQMQGLDQLWNADQPLLTFLDTALSLADRSKLLLAWDYTTQTTVDPLTASVASSPASQVLNMPLTGQLGGFPTLISVPTINGASVEAFLDAVLGVSQPACDAELHCNAVGDIYIGGVKTMNFQTATPNPMTGGAMIPGAWSDPVHPMLQSNPVIDVLAFVPVGAAPTAGWPVVIFGHGLGEKKEDLFAIGSQLAAAGYASVAIDDVASGSRAIQNSNAAALGCQGTPTYSAAPQCYAAILTTDLGTTRDNIRQTVLDMMSLANALKACGATGADCPVLLPTSPADTTPPFSAFPFAVDPTRIGYMGQSIGGIIGSTFTASDPDIKAAVLNVPGVGLLDILENTNSLAIRCNLVDSLITAGVLVGDPFDPGTGTGLCTTEAWETQPTYQTFSAAARWVLDPADGANYTPKLATRRFMIQEVVNDQVVPNVATNNEGALVGLQPAAAAVNTGTTQPSNSIAHAANTWVRYTTMGDASTGNAYQHGSLLSPVSAAGVPTTAGLLGMAQMQTDAITFMALNN